MSYGSGIALDKDWDLIVDETGDIKAVSGLQELEKDLAYVSAVRLGEESGTPLIEANLSQIEAILQQLLSRDPRIQRVIDVDASVLDGGDGIEVNLTIVAFREDNVETDLIFEVEQ